MSVLLSFKLWIFRTLLTGGKYRILTTAYLEFLYGKKASSSINIYDDSHNNTPTPTPTPPPPPPTTTKQNQWSSEKRSQSSPHTK